MGKVRECVLDPGRGCLNSGGCPRVINVEVLPLSEENKKARASWCDYKVSISSLVASRKPQVRVGRSYEDTKEPFGCKQVCSQAHDQGDGEGYQV